MNFVVARAMMILEATTTSLYNCEWSRMRRTKVQYLNTISCWRHVWHALTTSSLNIIFDALQSCTLDTRCHLRDESVVQALSVLAERWNRKNHNGSNRIVNAAMGYIRAGLCFVTFCVRWWLSWHLIFVVTRFGKLCKCSILCQVHYIWRGTVVLVEFCLRTSVRFCVGECQLAVTVNCRGPRWEAKFVVWSRSDRS